MKWNLVEQKRAEFICEYFDQFSRNQFRIKRHKVYKSQWYIVPNIAFLFFSVIIFPNSVPRVILSKTSFLSPYTNIFALITSHVFEINIKLHPPKIHILAMNHTNKFCTLHKIYYNNSYIFTSFYVTIALFP